MSANVSSLGDGQHEEGDRAGERGEAAAASLSLRGHTAICYQLLAFFKRNWKSWLLCKSLQVCKCWLESF